MSKCTDNDPNSCLDGTGLCNEYDSDVAAVLSACPPQSPACVDVCPEYELFFDVNYEVYLWSYEFTEDPYEFDISCNANMPGTCTVGSVCHGVLEEDFTLLSACDVPPSPNCGDLCDHFYAFDFPSTTLLSQECTNGQVNTCTHTNGDCLEYSEENSEIIVICPSDLCTDICERYLDFTYLSNSDMQ